MEKKKPTIMQLKSIEPNELGSCLPLKKRYYEA